MEFCVPELGEGIYEAELVTWFVQPGDQVQLGQNLAEVVTDKATMDLPSPFSGRIDRLSVSAGEIVQVGEVLLDYTPRKSAQADPPRVTEQAAAPPPEPLLSSPLPLETASLGGASDSLPQPLVSGDGHPTGSVVKAAPAVRQMASALGVNLHEVRGTGPDGRILIADLAAATGKSQPAAARRPRRNAMLDFGRAGTRVPMRGLRRQIAEHMLLSKRTIPHYSYVDECDVSALTQLLATVRRPLLQRGVRLTNLAFFVQAVVAALREVPLVNATLEEETAEVVLHDEYHIGIATSTSKGLLVPVIHHADRLDIAETARRIDILTRGARHARLDREHLQGSTFTISSIGTIGGMITTPIINHPEVGILGIGRTFKRPAYNDDGQIVPAHITYLSFSFDHRVVDGSVGATFGSAVIRHLQQPAVLLLSPDDANQPRRAPGAPPR